MSTNEHMISHTTMTTTVTKERSPATTPIPSQYHSISWPPTPSIFPKYRDLIQSKPEPYELSRAFSVLNQVEGRPRLASGMYGHNEHYQLLYTQLRITHPNP